MKVIIVGGVAGGMSAATRLRRLMEDAEILVIEKGPYVSFANCGLPYHLSGEIADREDLILQTPEKLKARFNLDVRVKAEVTRIDPDHKQVTIEGEGGSYQESYDKIILSPGADPFVPNMEGLDQAENVFSLRNIPDLDGIMAHLESQPGQQATVIGAGFIGLEMAENLAARGYQVSVVEMAPHVLPPLDEEMAAFIEAELTQAGVQVLTNRSATAFEDRGRTVVLSDGQKLTSDITILSVGVTPNTQIAVDAGIETGLRGAIQVDSNFQTSQPDIYAVGDAIVVKHQVTGQDALVSLANPANRQGRQVADVIAGIPRKQSPAIGTSIVRVFSLSAGSTGISERVARKHFTDVAVVHTETNNHAGYFPGASRVHLKLIFSEKTGQIYGAQAVGKDGVDKRIDVLATAIKAGLTVQDLPELELTYAPPFGAAKDPVNMVGYAAMNILEGQSENIQWHQLEAELASGKVLLDVRTDSELAAGRYPQALHIPLDDLRGRISELDPDLSYIVACQGGQRSYIAERILKQHGFQVKNLDGAFRLYSTVRPEGIVWPEKD